MKSGNVSMIGRLVPIVFLVACNGRTSDSVATSASTGGVGASASTPAAGQDGGHETEPAATDRAKPPARPVYSDAEAHNDPFPPTGARDGYRPGEAPPPPQPPELDGRPQATACEGSATTACSNDAECGDGKVCYCSPAGTVGYCYASDCRTDGDCPAGVCGMTAGIDGDDCSTIETEYRCQTPEDECALPGDCVSRGPLWTCNFDRLKGHRVCREQTCLRPVVPRPAP